MGEPKNIPDKTGKQSKKIGRVENLGNGPGHGRTKGALNKSTARARAAITLLVEENTERMQEWLDQIAETDGPKAAYQCLMDVLEYHIPKLARTEMTGPGGGEQVLHVKVSRE